MKQHFVPRFYLRLFIDPESPQGAYLWEGDLGTGRVDHQSPSAVCRIEDYYSFTDSEGLKRDDVEAFLHRMETDSAPILRKLCNKDFDLSGQERVRFAEMLTFLHNRVPYVRDTLSNFASDLWERILKMYASRPDAFARAFRESRRKNDEPEPTEEDLEKARRWMLEGGAKVELSRTGALQFMFSNADPIKDTLLQMHWSFFVAPSGRSFLSSDVPMSWLDPTPRPAFFSGSGLYMRNVEVSFPICPSVCLCATWNERQSGEVGLEVVDQLNLRRGMWGKALYGSSKSEVTRVVQIIRTVRSNRPG